MIDKIISFIVGLIVGGNVGLFAIAMCVMARKGDKK